MRGISNAPQTRKSKTTRSFAKHLLKNTVGAPDSEEGQLRDIGTQDNLNYSKTTRSFVKHLLDNLVGASTSIREDKHTCGIMNVGHARKSNPTRSFEKHLLDN